MESDTHQNYYNKQEDDRIRHHRLEKFKQLKQQQDKFAKLVQNQVDYDQPKVRQIICQGIPSRFRGAIWPEMIKNRHGITKELYSILLKKAVHMKANLSDFADKDSKVDSLKVLKHDISRTFVDIKIFRQNNEFSQTLEEILSTWVAYRPDIGYVQGMSNLAGFLITELKDYEAFAVFCTLVTSPTMVSHYSFNSEEISKFEKRFEHVFRINNEQLFFYFKEKEVITQLYLFEWVITLFTKCLEFQIVARVWDMIILYEGHWNFIVEVAYAIIHSARRELITMEAELIIRHLKSIKIDIQRQKQFFDHLCRYEM